MPQLLRIEREWAYNPLSSKKFKDCLGRARGAIVVVDTAHGEMSPPLGYLIWNRDYKVASMAVLSDYWRKGIGSRMMSYLITIARKHTRYVKVDVAEDNLSAQLFLRAIGLRWARTLREHWRPGSDVYRFVLDLEYPRLLTNRISKHYESVDCHPSTSEEREASK